MSSIISHFVFSFIFVMLVVIGSIIYKTYFQKPEFMTEERRQELEELYKEKLLQKRKDLNNKHRVKIKPTTNMN